MVDFDCISLPLASITRGGTVFIQLWTTSALNSQISRPKTHHSLIGGLCSKTYSRPDIRVMGQRMCGRLLIVTHQLINLQPYLEACPQSMDSRPFLLVFAAVVVTSDLKLMGNIGRKWGSATERAIPFHSGNSRLLTLSGASVALFVFPDYYHVNPCFANVVSAQLLGLSLSEPDVNPMLGGNKFVDFPRRMWSLVSE